SRYVSPGLDTVGAFLPYSPLHYILLKDLKTAIVATSANSSDSPIIKDNEEAIKRLEKTADGFLLHNRDIVRRCDDSVIRVISGKPIFIRRSRGYTPHVFHLPYKLNEPVLSVGGNQKVTIALGWEDKAVMSQHLGDLTTEDGKEAFENAIDDLTGFYNIKPARIVSDMHPDYISTKWAFSQNGIKHIQVQHHHAHIAACMLDNNLTDDVLGVSWDGSGYGTDGTIWGGEFLIADYKGIERFCTFRKFRLLGGEQAVKEPERALFSILYEIYGKDILTHTAKSLVWGQMLKKGFNSPFTTSAGRVFDAAASLLGICHKATYEGQGAMMLEANAEGRTGSSYPIEVKSKGGMNIFNWEPLFRAMAEDVRKGVCIAAISQNFHETLAQLILHVAKMARQEK
ncbi:MAG: Sua5/YciO/YrdC/YwlC family protein, partial [Deltaproteobacteria bacterium]